MAFYAHSTDRRDRSDWQGLADHLNGVGERAARHAEPFGGQLLARVAGKLHDLGKYTEKFQARLDGNPAQVDHATWGARIACARMSGKPDQNAHVDSLNDSLRDECLNECGFSHLLHTHAIIELYRWRPAACRPYYATGIHHHNLGTLNRSITGNMGRCGDSGSARHPIMQIHGY